MPNAIRQFCPTYMHRNVDYRQPYTQDSSLAGHAAPTAMLPLAYESSMYISSSPAQPQHPRHADSVTPAGVQPMTLPVVPLANQPVDKQQAQLIRELARLNAQTGDLLLEQPSLESLYQQQLAALFPDLHGTIDPNQIFYSRYREDEQGQKHLLSSEPLAALLNRLRLPDADDYLAQAPGAFYREGRTLEPDKRLSTAHPPQALARVLERACTTELRAFWRYRENGQPDIEHRLIAVRRQVLAHQLALHSLDGALSPAGRTLADTVLKYPDAATRERVVPADGRCGVYRLTLDEGSQFAGALILSATPETPPVGSVVLYTPGEGFEEYENLNRLNAAVAARLRKRDPAGKLLADSLPTKARAELGESPMMAAAPSRIDTDVIASSVRSLRTWQHHNVREALRGDTLPVAEALDLVADLAPQLDVCRALAARNLRLVQAREADWLSAAEPSDQALYRQRLQAMVDSSETLLPLLEKIPTLISFAESEVGQALKKLKPEYADVDVAPYKSLVKLRVTSSLPVTVTGYRDEHFDTVYISEDPDIDIPQFLHTRQLTKGTWSTQSVVDLRTLGSYARRNIEPLSIHALHRTITASADIIDTSGHSQGRLDDAALRTLAQEADIGKKYAEHLRSAFSQDGEGREFSTAWQRANAAKMHKDALESRLNPAIEELFTFKTPGSGFDWIQTITHYPDSVTRPKVGTFDIEAHLLVMGSGLEGGRGGQVINGVLVIARKGTKADGVCVLYTPDAPDNAPFRELPLGLVQLDTLKSKPEWRAYFTRRMATSDTQELERIFTDMRGVHRYTLTLISSDLQAYLYSAQLGFQLAHADYRSKSNADISRESAVNAFMFGAEVVDALADLLPAKKALAFLSRGVAKGSRRAQQLGRGLPALVKKVDGDRKIGFDMAKPSIRPLEPVWVDVTAYRLPKHIDPLFDVEAFAETNHYTLSRSLGAPSFIDGRNHQFIAIAQTGGRYYLYSSYVEKGARYVKHPTASKPDFMVVPGDAKSWKPRFDRTTRGGGQVLGALRTLSVEQQVDEDLITALHVYLSDEQIRRYGEEVKKTLPFAQKQQLLAHARQRMGPHVDEATFRGMVARQEGLRRHPPGPLRDVLLTLKADVDVHLHLHNTTLSMGLSPTEKDSILVKIKRMIGKDNYLLKSIQKSIRITDPDTNAHFVGYTITQKQFKSLEAFEKKYEISSFYQESLNAFLDEKGRRHIVNKIASDNNITQEEALERLLSDNSVNETFRTFCAVRFREKLKQLGVESYSDDFKKSGIPYIAISHIRRTGSPPSVKTVDSLTVAEFEKNIPHFSTPLELTSPQVKTKKIEKPSSAPDSPAPAQPLVALEAAPNIVRIDELAAAQIPLLPDNAKTKLEEIIQDIEAGRVSRKKIGNFTYVDLPQLDPGSGRGRWRAAFEKTGKADEKDIFILRGIIDYHASKLKAWGL
ncbi:DUF6543 domain-containing protein [Pseudomonas lactucae]|uniref:Dermonecrotic toxin N-terminal domain-containing protein n=1 Tax=Pseudomonas lactucae TaxID=2813360 RepID=A0A9X0YD32_9PSED|nr:DUF6543 domain-containing protein [Pseudomonas lactucae]MBN2977714.1 hypothetical protein [Pseudomonas lactucae]